MIVKGLNKDLYLVNNPIWVECSELAQTVRYVEITITNITNPSKPRSTAPLRLYPIDSTIRYNLQEFIKGNFEAPSFPENPVNDESINTNYAKFSITIMEQVLETTYTSGSPLMSGSPRDTFDEIGTLVVRETVKTGDQATFNKTFIRGGRRSQETNISLSIGDTLHNSPKIPKWGGYPLRKFYIGADKQIKSTTFLSIAETELMKTVGCDPMYIRFLNDMGGYSYWMFESWEQKTKFESMELAKYDMLRNHLGVMGKDTIQTETRVNKRHFDTLRSLLRSPEIHAYNRFGKTWAHVYVADNDFVDNGYETTMKVQVNFKVELEEKSATVW